MVERAAETAEVEQAFGGAVEGHAHAVKQIDDGWSRFAHGFDGVGLIGEEVAAIDGVVKVLVGGVSLTLEVLCGVDAALCAYGVRALDGDDGEQVDRTACFGDLDDRCQARQASANHDDSRCCCHACTFFVNLELVFNQCAGNHHGSADATYPICDLQIPIQGTVLVLFTILPNHFSRITTAFEFNFPMELHNLCHLRHCQIAQNRAAHKYGHPE